ncbi:triphosphoribosyl-dephospho-CoA synthase CitG [Telmatospirillum siberiense]|uniref:Probable 2-(5''-triphosphoribosyl)-3'-dephosphocoenzyme-A synthase n=1 Tax=Telmatospirillum siberiense TaxID=382514 RepID=A0A2N3PLR5_9PROT|nr:triphosphoribosyl-dephospho-CoA synthase CitG [Telmatospirillum siberiense]
MGFYPPPPGRRAWPGGESCSFHHQELVARLAHGALIREVLLTPKPGLVDRRNSGAHRDMGLDTFLTSAEAIAPWFSKFFLCGMSGHRSPAEHVLAMLRSDGVACEKAMFAATGGINTHKGSVFAFGLLCGAVGRCHGQGRPLDVQTICDEVAGICRDLVERELDRAGEATTAGEHLFHQYGLTGARGEAASGFQTVRTFSLPAFLAVEAETGSEQLALFAALLALLASNADTNLVARGGPEGLLFVQREASRLLAEGGVHAPYFMAKMAAFDDALIKRNLSPGGSADLLAVTWFLARLSLFRDHNDKNLPKEEVSDVDA